MLYVALFIPLENNSLDPVKFPYKSSFLRCQVDTLILQLLLLLLLLLPSTTSFFLADCN